MTRSRLIDNAIVCGVALFFAAAMASGGPFLHRGVRNLRALENVAPDDATLRSRNQNAFATILGEARASAADLMFVKTNRYLHAGVAYAPRLNMDAADSGAMLSDCGSGTPTMIRGAAEDFRGFLGSIERAVKPYKPQDEDHTHLSGAELIPWYRVITLTHPQYVRGYRLGARSLVEQQRWEEAEAFLQEGIRKNSGNPQLFLLYQSLATLHLGGRFDMTYPWGEEWTVRALEAAEQAYHLGLEQRTALGKPGEIRKDLVWNEDLEGDFRHVAHIVPLLMRDAGRVAEALETAKEMLEKMPSYRPLHNTVENLRARLEEEGGPVSP